MNKADMIPLGQSEATEEERRIVLETLLKGKSVRTSPFSTSFSLERNFLVKLLDSADAVMINPGEEDYGRAEKEALMTNYLGSVGLILPMYTAVGKVRAAALSSHERAREIVNANGNDAVLSFAIIERQFGVPYQMLDAEQRGLAEEQYTDLVLSAERMHILPTEFVDVGDRAIYDTDTDTLWLYELPDWEWKGGAPKKDDLIAESGLSYYDLTRVKTE